MKAYIIGFGLSLFCASLAGKFFEIEKNKKGKIFLILAFFIVCYIAGVRTITTGRDVTVYVTRAFESACNSSNIISFFKKSEIELGFATLIYISAIFKDINITLFIIELFISVPILIFIYRNCKKKSCFFIMAIFLFTMFCGSLNIMRQYMAMTWIVLAFDFYISNEKKKALFCFALAISFHNTAIIACLAFFIYRIIKSNNKNRLIYICFIIMLIMIFSIFMDKILLISTDYSFYLNRINSYELKSIIFGAIKKLFWIIAITIPLVGYKKNNNNEKDELLTAIVFFIIDFILFLCNIKVSSAGRIGYYFLILAYFVGIPILIKNMKKNLVLKLIIFLILAAFWYNMTVNDINAWIYPYESDIVVFLNN